ncbi:hypothetical protein OFN32_34635, partial [Escherichia coli]|nr:hypothetical protein [Escherichia coli]
MIIAIDLPDDDIDLPKAGDNLAVDVRLPPTAVVGDIVTVNLTPSTQAAAASSDTKAYSASQTLVQADIDARSVNIEFE